MKRFFLVLTSLILAAMIVVSPARAAGTDISVSCTLSTCTVTPASVPMFDEQNIWPGFSVTHTITAQNTTAQNGDFGITAAEITGEREVSSVLKNSIFIEIRQGSSIGPVVYGPSNSKTLGDLFNDTQLNQIVLGSMGPTSSDQYFVKATLDPNAGNELMNESVTFNLGLGYVFTPKEGGNGGENPGGSNGGGGNGGSSDTGNSGGGPGPAPTCTEAAPTNAPLLFFTESSTADGQITLGWTPATGANNYAINFGVQPGVYIYGNNNVGNVTSYTVSGLTPGGKYYFQVLGIFNCAPGPRSNEVSTNGGAVQGLVAPPNGFGSAQVLGANDVIDATGEAESTPSGSVLGDVLGDATCNSLKQFLPLLFLVIQVISALVIYGLMRKPENRIKQALVLGIAVLLTLAFYLLRNCNCFEATIWSFLCQWYVLVAVVLAGVLQFANYALIEKEE